MQRQTGKELWETPQTMRSAMGTMFVRISPKLTSTVTYLVQNENSLQDLWSESTANPSHDVSGGGGAGLEELVHTCLIFITSNFVQNAILTPYNRTSRKRVLPSNCSEHVIYSPTRMTEERRKKQNNFVCSALTNHRRDSPIAAAVDYFSCINNEC